MGVPDGAYSIEKGTQTSRSAVGRRVPWWRQKTFLVLATCLAALVVVMVIVITTLTTGHVFESVPNTTYTENPTEIPFDPELTLPGGRRIASRSSWSSVEPDFVRPLRHPTPYVVIGQTAGVPCRGEDECFDVLRAYRDEHRSKWLQPDIAYNFLIDLEGNVYEGRGWDATNNYASWAKRCNLGIVLMGNFMNVNMTTEMVQSLQQLLDLGVSLGKLDPDYRLVAHSQLMPTLSPGDNVRNVIDKWPHRCLSDCTTGVQCLEEDADVRDA